MINIDQIYPIGYVYMTTNSAFNPNEYSPFNNTTWSSVNDSAANISITSDPGLYTGENFVTLTLEQMQSHNHTGTGAFTKPGSTTGTRGNTTIRSMWNKIDTTAGNGYGDGTTTFYSSGGNSAHNNMQPYFQIYKWIRTN